MDPTQYEEVGGDQLVQVVGNITKDDLGGFNSDQALGIATNLDTGDLQNQGDALAGEIFGGVPDDTITALDQERAKAALIASGAAFSHDGV